MREINLKFKQPHNTHVHLTHVNQQTFWVHFEKKEGSHSTIYYEYYSHFILYIVADIYNFTGTYWNEQIKRYSLGINFNLKLYNMNLSIKIFKIHVQKMIINLKSLIDFDVHLHLSMSEKEGHSVQHLYLCYVFTCRIV